MRKIIIIGGGIAGLSAGCYAQMNGYDAHIFEMHDLPGGLCTSWTRKGYIFDLCIQWLEGSTSQSPYHRIWRELGALEGKNIYFKDMYAKIFLKDQSVSLYSDPDKLDKYLKTIAPEDSGLIDELIQSMRETYRLNELPLTKPKELFSLIDTIKLFRMYFPFRKLFKKFMKTTLYDFADKFTNPLLRQALRSVKGDTVFDQFAILPYLLATGKSGFPEGGSRVFAESIEQRFLSLGGSIDYGTKISKILVSNDRAVGIRLEDGREEKADIVISAADGYSTIYKMLEGKYTNKKITHIYKDVPVYHSYLQVSIGVNMDLSGHPDLDTIYNIYKLDQPIQIGGEDKKFFYYKNYAFDPSLAPRGKSCLIAAFNSVSAYWEKIYEDKELYNREKKQVEEVVLSCLEKIIPGIREKIEVVDVATPMTIIRYTNNWKGSIMGFAAFSNLNIPRTIPKLKNFYMAGQWVGDSGVSGAAKSGRDCLQIICSKDKKRFTTSLP